MQKAVAVDTAGAAAPTPAPMTGQGAVLPILISLGFCHLLNDLMQSLVPALYPMLKEQFRLDFTQIGLITLAFQLTASLLQPTIGIYTDRRPQPYSLAVGMGATLIGLLLLAKASDYVALLHALPPWRLPTSTSTRCVTATAAFIAS